ncbi:cation-translocating P-type ATPase [Candidatus Fermentibacteria bacterium]|nr:cation-translocating P-type ATPase [Candidatus Fermentibacteria bacterium]
MTNDPTAPWTKAAEDLAADLGVDLESGLPSANASALLVSHGLNELVEEKGPSLLVQFLGQFNNFMVWVLIGAGIIAGILQEWVDTVAITGIVILNALMGFIQEHRAEKALAALRRMSSPVAKVRRGGTTVQIPAAQVVPGDVVELEAGDAVPADARITWATGGFAVQEASLTGESQPVFKTAATLERAKVPLAERRNMVFMGTSAVAGKARAMVMATGMHTELGKIAGMLHASGHEPTPLQRRLTRFGKILVYVCLALVSLVFLVGWLHGRSLLESFLTAVSLAVAVIPEGLPAVVTIALALGVHRMAARNALVRKLPSVETLGCATVICSDKTGTLTRNEMTVRAVYAGHHLNDVSGIGYAPEGRFLRDGAPFDAAEDADLLQTLLCGTLCNGATLESKGGTWRVIGDPTEGALLTVAGKAGLSKKALEEIHDLAEEIPFDSQRKRMTMLRRFDGDLVAYVKGAPDLLLDRCARILENGTVRPMDDHDRTRILEANGTMTRRAMRVLGAAYRTVEEQETVGAEIVERDLIFAGLLAMIDPPRQEVKDAVDLCKEAGIRTVMITGDHQNTAVAVATELGFFETGSEAVTGEGLESMTDEQLTGSVKRIAVYARVSPEHKLRIVKAWKRLGEIVAMTGDGVNDAPAVKEADIGVAMGITGTDVTKEVSDMVITDDNFASIVSAVEEGRGIYDNIRKFIHYLLSCNCGEMLVMLVSTFAGTPVPLLPIQILWVNLVTDGLPALALGVDPMDPHVMRRPPRPPKEPLINRRTLALILFQGTVICLCSLGVFLFVLKGGGSIREARTMALAVLAGTQLFHSLNCRSQTESLFTLGIFTNRSLVFAFLGSFVLQFAVITLPGVRDVFKTQPLTMTQWGLVVALSSLPLWAGEVRKLLQRRGKETV